MHRSQSLPIAYPESEGLGSVVGLHRRSEALEGDHALQLLHVATSSPRSFLPHAVFSSFRKRATRIAVFFRLFEPFNNLPILRKTTPKLPLPLACIYERCHRTHFNSLHYLYRCASQQLCMLIGRTVSTLVLAKRCLSETPCVAPVAQRHQHLIILLPPLSTMSTPPKTREIQSPASRTAQPGGPHVSG